MMNYVLRHWRGQLPLSISFFVNFLGLNVLIFLLAQNTAGGMVAVSPYHSAAIILVKLALALLVSIWQLVGLFRCAINQPTWIVRIAVIGITLLAAANQLRLAYQHQAQYLGIARLAFRIDALPEYQVLAQPEKKLLIINGPFGIGIADTVEQLLSDARYEIIILNSPGGYIYEGRRVAELIRRHDLSTTSISQCSSICTLAFLAGKHRFLAPGASLGFHQYASDFISAKGLINEQAEDMATFAGYGISPAFIEKIYQTPPEQLWVPSREELLNARVISQ